MAADSPDVHLLYNPGAPKHYTARLGRTGWTEGSGFTEPEALASVVAWLATANSEATLDE